MPDASLPPASPNVLVAPLADEAVLLDLDSKRYFQLNATGKEIWDGLVAGEDRNAIVDRLVREFEVAPADAEAAMDDFVRSLRGHALVADR